MESPSNPRLIALKMLTKVLQDKQTLRQCLDTNLAFGKLSASDKGFCLNLVQTSLRFKGELTHLYKSCLKNSAQDLPFKVQLCLLMGGAQLVHLKTPSHAAVNETVELAKTLKLDDFVALINAVLHRMDKRSTKVLGQLDRVKINISGWLYGRLKKNYGADKINEIGQALLQPPSTYLYYKDKHKVVLHEAKDEVTKLEGFAEGKFWVQDVASAQPLLELGEAALKGKTLLDMCAAPGGKAMQAANMGAQVTAVDVSANRLKRLAENAERTGLDIDIVCKDALKLSEDTKYDIVLLDAPCTATGTLRKSPEIMHIKDEADIKEMAALQAKLLAKAGRLVKGGGTVIYCTCSLLYEENAAHFKDKKPQKMRTVLPVKFEHGCNGFFYAFLL